MKLISIVAIVLSISFVDGDEMFQEDHVIENGGRQLAEGNNLFKSAQKFFKTAGGYLGPVGSVVGVGFDVWLYSQGNTITNAVNLLRGISESVYRIEEQVRALTQLTIQYHDGATKLTTMANYKTLESEIETVSSQLGRGNWPESSYVTHSDDLSDALDSFSNYVSLNPVQGSRSDQGYDHTKTFNDFMGTNIQQRSNSRRSVSDLYDYWTAINGYRDLFRATITAAYSAYDGLATKYITTFAPDCYNIDENTQCFGDNQPLNECNFDSNDFASGDRSCWKYFTYPNGDSQLYKYASPLELCGLDRSCRGVFCLPSNTRDTCYFYKDVFTRKTPLSGTNTGQKCFQKKAPNSLCNIEVDAVMLQNMYNKVRTKVKEMYQWGVPAATITVNGKLQSAYAHVRGQPGALVGINANYGEGTVSWEKIQAERWIKILRDNYEGSNMQTFLEQRGIGTAYAEDLKCETNADYYVITAKFAAFFGNTWRYERGVLSGKWSKYRGGEKTCNDKKASIIQAMATKQGYSYSYYCADSVYNYVWHGECTKRSIYRKLYSHYNLVTIHRNIGLTVGGYIARFDNAAIEDYAFNENTKFLTDEAASKASADGSFDSAAGSSTISIPLIVGASVGVAAFAGLVAFVVVKRKRTNSDIQQKQIFVLETPSHYNGTSIEAQL